MSCPGPLRLSIRDANPAGTIAVKLAGMDLPWTEKRPRLEPQMLEKVAALYRELGWPARVEDSAYSAPSAGPPPWDLYRFTYTRVVGLSTAEPNGATLWQFGGI